MNEQWVGLQYKDIDYSSKYEISNLGKIRNRETGKILKTHLDRDGYVVIGLRKPGTTNNPKTLRIHRLLMWNFIEQSDLEIDHIDMNKQNNDLSNLQYVKHIENQHRLYKSNKGHNIEKTLKENAKKMRKKIKQYSIKDDFIKEYESISQAMDITGIPLSNISNCLNGYIKTAGGYKWKYV